MSQPRFASRNKNSRGTLIHHNIHKLLLKSTLQFLRRVSREKISSDEPSTLDLHTLDCESGHSKSTRSIGDRRIKDFR